MDKLCKESQISSQVLQTYHPETETFILLEVDNRADQYLMFRGPYRGY